jgi:hypothetical protein
MNLASTVMMIMKVAGMQNAIDTVSVLELVEKCMLMFSRQWYFLSASLTPFLPVVPFMPLSPSFF